MLHALAKCHAQLVGGIENDEGGEEDDDDAKLSAASEAIMLREFKCCRGSTL